ncbi:hypothetical protein BJ508DRAFT_308356 [Ascobolus immersus RN42]|uniref:F-box domain-containing protein n=1 Tax=Ascobolus immersus RN42 TaxID=1160509 RepID=A0A3N4HZZ0_ASCIM|nr:hypothetical protein BJ508DRAFT_308356 [Ascobolus immersus RN42]
MQSSQRSPQRDFLPPTVTIFDTFWNFVARTFGCTVQLFQYQVHFSIPIPNAKATKQIKLFHHSPTKWQEPHSQHLPLRQEINAYPRIILKSYGYREIHLDFPPDGVKIPKGWWRAKFYSPPDKPWTGISIYHVGQCIDRAERHFWRKRYYPKERWNGKDARWHCCPSCSMVYKNGFTPVRDDDGNTAASLLTIPRELRLCIYAQCTIFSLLQLSSTSSLLHHEINAYPSIVRASYGFRDLDHEAKNDDGEHVAVGWTGISINFVGKVKDRKEIWLWEDHYEKKQEREARTRDWLYIICRGCREMSITRGYGEYFFQFVL